MDARVCAFCGVGLYPDQPGAVFLVVGSERDEARQELFAHASCLVGRLHPGTPFEASAFEPNE